MKTNKPPGTGLPIHGPPVMGVLITSPRMGAGREAFF